MGAKKRILGTKNACRRGEENFLALQMHARNWARKKIWPFSLHLVKTRAQRAKKKWRSNDQMVSLHIVQ